MEIWIQPLKWKSRCYVFYLKTMWFCDDWKFSGMILFSSQNLPIRGEFSWGPSLISRNPISHGSVTFSFMIRIYEPGAWIMLNAQFVLASVLLKLFTKVRFPLASRIVWLHSALQVIDEWPTMLGHLFVLYINLKPSVLSPENDLNLRDIK